MRHGLYFIMACVVGVFLAACARQADPRPVSQSASITPDASSTASLPAPMPLPSTNSIIAQSTATPCPPSPTPERFAAAATTDLENVLTQAGLEDFRVSVTGFQNCPNVAGIEHLAWFDIYLASAPSTDATTFEHDLETIVYNWPDSLMPRENWLSETAPITLHLTDQTRQWFLLNQLIMARQHDLKGTELIAALFGP